MYGRDICVINETGLYCDEYVEFSTLYSWVETNIDWSKGKSGGASFILKSDIRYEQVMPDGEYISFIKNMDGMFE